jgi:hypothetical protein
MNPHSAPVLHKDSYSPEKENVQLTQHSRLTAENVPYHCLTAIDPRYTQQCLILLCACRFCRDLTVVEIFLGLKNGKNAASSTNVYSKYRLMGVFFKQ